MKLIDALEVLKLPVAEDAPRQRIYLACGFTPLHLQTFLTAQLKSQLPQRQVEVETGIFGDLAGNLERLEPSGLHALAVVLEWEDLDSRLGVRTLGGWQPSNLPDIVESTGQAAARLLLVLCKVSRFVPTVVCMPTLPLPPLFWTLPDRAASCELQIHQTVASLAVSLAEQTGARIVNAQLLSEISPPDRRFDLRSAITAGFPYTLAHASTLAELLCKAIENRLPKKGLITDLDDTLWAGILGEDGVHGISWDLEHHTHLHGLYQQIVASLAGAGVLVAAASKNDPALVEQVFDRSDLLLSRKDIFPLEVHWARKSESVERILDAWNIGADSVVFIDDSPMEVAEVKTAFPELECIVFPKNEYRAMLWLFKHLREVFGKPFLTEDDNLRLESIRAASEWRNQTRSESDPSEEFLRTAAGSIVFSLARADADARAFELVNKTNQFNLNGKRFSESEWQSLINDPTAFILSVTYSDKFGPLGKIAVILGRAEGSRLDVRAWVMSCRAFSRRIEHHCLKFLFDKFGAAEIVFDLQETSHNAPLRSFLKELTDGPIQPNPRLSRSSFLKEAREMPHQMEEVFARD